jgi:rare lipoprotein A
VSIAKRRIPLGLVLGTVLLLLLTGCGSMSKKAREAPPQPPAAVPASQEAQREDSPALPSGTQGDVAPGKRSGRYYLDDGPGDNPPRDLDQLADAVPRPETPHPYANQPYIAFGARYVPTAAGKNYKARGIASWYGKRFHGKPTASGEPYDMYQMTAAHPTLPIPSYVRVTNLANKRRVIVRINDRGPFLESRVIDLSYAAAYKLGYAAQGSAEVEVEALSSSAAQALAPAVLEENAAAASAAPGIYLQLGAFGAQSSAESFRDRMARELTWLGASLQVWAEGGLFRVRAGPYRSTALARSAAARIERATSLAPVVLGP